MCIFPRVFHNNSLCKTWGANRVHYGELENREWEFVQPSLALKLFARENVAFYMEQDFLFHIEVTFFRFERASISINWNRGKCGDKLTSKKFQMNLASGAGSPGWSRTRPKLVSCEAWWLRTNKRTNWLKNVTICGWTNKLIKISFVHQSGQKEQEISAPWKIWTLDPWFTRPVLFFV